MNRIIEMLNREIEILISVIDSYLENNGTEIGLGGNKVGKTILKPWKPGEDKKHNFQKTEKRRLVMDYDEYEISLLKPNAFEEVRELYKKMKNIAELVIYVEENNEFYEVTKECKEEGYYREDIKEYTWRVRGIGIFFKGVFKHLALEKMMPSVWLDYKGDRLIESKELINIIEEKIESNRSEWDADYLKQG